MKTTLANQPLAELLDQHTALSAPELVRTEGDRLRCLACGHRCLIGEGQRGICKVRFNSDASLKVPFGYVAGLQSDPVEKKPFFHVYPGTDALTFGMMGCDLHCSYCQNWITSQALRDAAAVAPVRPVTPTQLVDIARREKSRLVVSSYNEPLITAEWAVAVFKEAKAAGLDCAFVSNGNATPEVLDFLRRWIVAYKVDLKSFDDRHYRQLGGVLDNITTTIRMIHERGIWLEIVTLVIPGFNDDPQELREIARFLAGISRDIPWHITAFHKDYRMTEPDATSADALVRAAEIGAEEGLRYIYAGNLPGRVGQWENTRCPLCETTVIDRVGYRVRAYRLTSAGGCPQCATKIPGIWPAAGEVVKVQETGVRLPRPLSLRGAPVMAATNPSAASAPNVVPQRPSLSGEQKEQVVTAVAAMLRKLVGGGPAEWPAHLADLGKTPVAGAFVSLKRGRHLRSCCGMLTQALPLSNALTHAAERAIWDDERFPPVSASELPYLEMEIWLLFNSRQIQARGEERARHITIGTHGVQVISGQSRGLFLPSVAVESQWDVFRLLDRVCLKAGLSASAWRDDSTTVLTFEGEAFHASLGVPDGPKPVVPVGCCQLTDMPKLTDLCRKNLIDLLRGAAPRYFVGAPDGMINGAVFAIERPGTAEVRHFSRFSLRPGFALQATLFALVQSAAAYLAKHGVAPESAAKMAAGLTLLYDPVLHGSVADPHLEGFDAKHRAFLVIEREKAGLMFDKGRDAAELLQDAVAKARVTKPENAQVFSLAALTNADQVGLSTAPNPVRGPAVRPPAVAGKFYDADPAELSRTVDALLAGAAQVQSWPAAMVPHAGLKYSGRIAADVLKRIKIPSTVIVIGPSHTGKGMDWAVAPHQTWELPGIEIQSDFSLARKLCESIPGLEMDAAAHRQEHAIEVELPLLARLAPQSKVLGITIGHGDLESCRRFAKGLAEFVRGRRERPLLLISSDMNHFATDAETRRLDALALTALEKGDPAELYQTVTSHNISMCGVLPAVIVLETLRLLNQSTKVERVGYATTADVTGDKGRVVGYAGVLLGEPGA
jgi:AmmeMemoRadiSam system radical SAM enzyme/AmmeMemoRadiSam system protein B/AmmeMemoRadiSam system protein A